MQRNEDYSYIFESWKINGQEVKGLKDPRKLNPKVKHQGALPKRFSRDKMGRINKRSF